MNGDGLPVGQKLPDSSALPLTQGETLSKVKSPLPAVDPEQAAKIASASTSALAAESPRTPPHLLTGDSESPRATVSNTPPPNPATAKTKSTGISFFKTLIDFFFKKKSPLAPQKQTAAAPQAPTDKETSVATAKETPVVSTAPLDKSHMAIKGWNEKIQALKAIAGIAKAEPTKSPGDVAKLVKEGLEANPNDEHIIAQLTKLTESDATMEKLVNILMAGDKPINKTLASLILSKLDAQGKLETTGLSLLKKLFEKQTPLESREDLFRKDPAALLFLSEFQKRILDKRMSNQFTDLTSKISSDPCPKHPKSVALQADGTEKPETQNLFNATDNVLEQLEKYMDDCPASIKELNTYIYELVSKQGGLGQAAANTYVFQPFFLRYFCIKLIETSSQKSAVPSSTSQMQNQNMLSIATLLQMLVSNASKIDIEGQAQDIATRACRANPKILERLEVIKNKLL